MIKTPVLKLFHFISLLFLAGALIMTFFLILSGGREGGTLKNFYWLEANTTGFNDAQANTRWFDYTFCGYTDGKLHDCAHRAPAKPFSPRDNFGRSDEMPSSFLNHRDAYYYLSRVGWAMLLIGLFFEVLTFFPAILSLFKVMAPTATFTTVMSWLALFFILLAACLYTGCYAKAKKAFHSQHRHAKMGAKNFAFLWTSVFLLMCTTAWTTVTIALHNKERKANNIHGGYAEDYAGYSTTDNTTAGDKSAPYDPESGDDQQPATSHKYFTKLRSKKHQKTTAVTPVIDETTANAAVDPHQQTATTAIQEEVV
ncbi:Fmp45p KNAG_0L02370 [Huiozyma naganishii CBS 8797]|uniref:SUR7 family protein FMP45 n=1 Tax=Huiozyma naganishii (strain ATCC MYA-139 / BCRC 22969 / CBS 8797 / KCTC 17520 / NBRC 10181 / NCYC 3082 / Yp74L-3) TaxID=1071383 RepID=J7S3W0_HUIN7|nr:hypothetical protein KNAG_0L02370 [Kazachstania naganishii CBS 8797]CCK72852.1 hypothetical protein KNAG_0L02370 [Kazachstania naganishii CBS 8797]